METIKVQTSGKLSLIFGTITLIILVIGSISMTSYAFKTPKEIPILIIALFPLMLLGFVTFFELKTYINRRAIEVYVVEKKGKVDFDELSEKYIQIEDLFNKLYFVKKEDYKGYQEFKLFYDISNYTD